MSVTFVQVPKMCVHTSSQRNCGLFEMSSITEASFFVCGTLLAAQIRAGILDYQARAILNRA